MKQIVTFRLLGLREIVLWGTIPHIMSTLQSDFCIWIAHKQAKHVVRILNIDMANNTVLSIRTLATQSLPFPRS